MPELPEVETARRGLTPLLSGRSIDGWTVRNPNLRWPVRIPAELKGQRIVAVRRRAKYLVIEVGRKEHEVIGGLIFHLGMSGSLRVVPSDTPIRKHDHVDIELSGRRVLRLHDPRRFGSVHWQAGPVCAHWLLAKLGPEPLSPEFSGAYLKARARGRRVTVKTLIMDGHVVVGVGNIYANEALYLAGIRPTARAGRVTRVGYERLAAAIRQVLLAAIAMGGTTLRDFVNHDGNPGYFRQSLNVYGRAGESCRACAATLQSIGLNQRVTVFCPKCQSAQNFNGRS